MKQLTKIIFYIFLMVDVQHSYATEWYDYKYGSDNTHPRFDSCKARSRTIFGRPNKKNAISQYETLPAEFFSGSRKDYSFFRVVITENEFYEFRRPDYNNGFFICIQTAVGGEKEYNADSVDFNVLKKHRTFVLHYSNQTEYPDESEAGGMVSLTIPYFVVRYKEIKNLSDLDTFSYDLNTDDWLDGYKAEAYRVIPDHLMVFARLNIYTAEKQRITKATNYKYDNRTDQIIEKTNERIDPDMINHLKQLNQYDTIIKTDTSLFYFNCDMESYEQPDAPDIFYIIKREYYPNGNLKSYRRFIPAIYSAHTLHIGMSLFYDINGNLTDLRDEEYEKLLVEPMVTVPYLLQVLEHEGWIDTKTGRGKAIISLQENNEPSDKKRLSIRSAWQITTDHSTSNNSTVALVVAHDNKETVYVIRKVGKEFLKRFDRFTK